MRTVSHFVVTAIFTVAPVGQVADAAGAEVNNAPPGPPVIVSTFNAEPGAKYPFRQNMYEPILLPDGRILALSIARQTGQQTMQGRYSTNEGRTWTAPQDLFDFPKQAGGFAIFDCLVSHNGDVHILILCDANSGVLFPASQEAAPDRPGEILDIWHVKSQDGLRRWIAPHRIWSGHGDDLLSVIQMHTGRLVLPISFRRRQDMFGSREGFEGFTYYGLYSVTSLYSDDDGDTWQKSPDILSVQTPDLHTWGANEPVVLELKDGRVWMLLRTQRGRFYESFSPNGIRWSSPTPTRLISSDSPAGLMRLKDGSILLFCNACLRFPYGYGGHDALHGAISKDEGRTWQGFRELMRDPARNQPADFRAGDYGCSYSFPTLTPQGHVLFTNWVETQAGKVRSFKLFDPAWLLQKHQETDFSAGLDDWSIYGSKGVELQPSPSDANARALCLRKLEDGWPSAAVWNFPMGTRGTLVIRLMLRPGFKGARLGLTDHYSVPWDDEDVFHNVFNIDVDADGEILPSVKLTSGEWQDLKLDWDTSPRQCRLNLNGKDAGVLSDNRRSGGLNYLRLRSTAGEPDGGLLVARVTVDVSGSWQDSKNLYSLHAR